MSAIVALSERSVDVAGVRVRHRVAGEGDPLVLVHGLSGSTRWWTPVLPALAARRAVHRVDLPGFGALRGGRRFVLSEASAWLAAWMDAAGLERPALVGHSMGGAIALRLAAAHPDRLERLAVIAPAGIATGRSLLGYAVPLAVTLRGARPRFLAVLATDALRAGPRTLARAAHEIRSEDVRTELARVSVPTLVLVGERDTLVPPAVAELVRESLPAARVIVLEGAGHVPMFDRPDAVAAALLEFIDAG